MPMLYTSPGALHASRNISSRNGDGDGDCDEYARPNILGFNEHSTVALHVRCNGGAFRCCFLKNNNVKRPNSKFCEEHEHTTGHLTTLANSSARL